MMEIKEQPKICPRCKNSYVARSALSRMDGKSKICPNCGTEEAMIESTLLPKTTEQGIIESLEMLDSLIDDAKLFNNNFRVRHFRKIQQQLFEKMENL